MGPKYLTPRAAVEQYASVIEALEHVDHGMIGDGGGPTFDQECGADEMREKCIHVVQLWLERRAPRFQFDLHRCTERVKTLETRLDKIRKLTEGRDP